MEKIPQEIAAAVLAYCHEVCPKTGDKWGSKCETFSLSNNGPLMGQQWKLSFNGHELRIDSGMDGIYSMLCYYIFGLDKRDALEAHTRKEAEFEARMNLMDAKQEKYMNLYRAERGKSAKLIEALEEINNVPTKMQESIDIYKESGYQLKTDSELVEKIAEFGFGELEFHTADIERLVTQSGIAFNALAAYKEGKKDE